jgi:hypothetical protein
MHYSQHFWAEYFGVLKTNFEKRVQIETLEPIPDACFKIRDLKDTVINRMKQKTGS